MCDDPSALRVRAMDVGYQMAQTYSAIVASVLWH